MIDIAGILTGVAPLFIAIGGAIQGSKFIQEGQRGFKMRFGKVVRDRAGKPKVRNPGFIFVIPSVEHLVRQHVRQRTVLLPSQKVMLADKMTFEVAGMVMVRVRDTADDLYASLFNIDDLEGSVRDYVTSALREVLREMDHDKVLADRDGIVSELTSRITDQLGAWGLDVLSVHLTDCSPTPSSARAIQTEVEARMRAEALVAVALKVAESPAVARLSPTVAAALVGTPVVAQLGETATQERSVKRSS